MHLLVDTNIFIDYIKDGNEESCFELILNAINDGKIILLVPYVVRKEWEEKKNIALELLKKNHYSFNQISAESRSTELLKTSFKRHVERVEFVEKLLARGKHITASQRVKSHVVDRMNERKAPFHNKRNSLNDGLLYFATIAYLKRNGVKSFYFVSRNTVDFGMPNEKYKLHHELLVTGLETKYFTSLYGFVTDSDINVSIDSGIKNQFGQILVSDQKSRNLLDYLYDVLKIANCKLAFIPSFLLCRIVPLTVYAISGVRSYCQNETLVTNNVELFELFKGVDMQRVRFKDGGKYLNTPKNLSKLRFIIKKLNENLIFSLSLYGSNEELSIRLQSKKICKCYACRFTSRNLFENPQVGEGEKLFEKAFALFRLGMVRESIALYFDLYQKAKLENNKIVEYRCVHILQWCNQFSFGLEEFKDSKIPIEIKAFDSERLLTNILIDDDPLDKEIAMFLNRRTHLDYYARLISDKTTAIRKHYELQLRGGHSSNSNLESLFWSFREFELFYLFNGLTINRFSDFEMVCQDFTEGVFISGALNHHQSSRLDFVDDFILNSLLLYSKADQMISFYNKYPQDRLLYKSESGLFKSNTLSFLSSSEDLIAKYAETSGYSAEVYFNRLWNIMVIVSIFKFNSGFVKKCLFHIFKFLPLLPKSENRNTRHLFSFMHANRDILSKLSFDRMIRTILTLSVLHNDSTFKIFGIAKFKGISVDFPKKQLEELVEMIIVKCPNCKTSHHLAIVNLYGVLSKCNQQLVGEMITASLTSSFDQDLYYFAVMADIIPYDKFFPQYLASIPKPAKKSDNFLFLQGDVIFKELNELVNILYKIGDKIPAFIVEKYKGISDYYDWLLDMENFDYRRFDPLWIVQYPTDPFLKKMFTLKDVQVATKRYLKNMSHPMLAKYFVANVSSS